VPILRRCWIVGSHGDGYMTLGWKAGLLCLTWAVMLVVPGFRSAAQATAQGPELAGIAHAAIRVSDLAKSRDFYEKLGFEEAFAMDQGGTPTQSFIKINDQQFLELYPQRDPTQAIGFMHVCFESGDLEGLNRYYVTEGLKPNAVRRAGAGNLLFTMTGPEEQNIEYTQYMPGSKHTNDRGKHLGAHRIAEKIVAVGIEMQDPAAARTFYTEKLAFGTSVEVEPGQIWLKIPGQSGQKVEIVQHGAGSAFQLFFGVDNLRSTAAQLKALQIPVEKYKSMLSILDPDGNRIVFVTGKQL
jgi:catechol 2,3-dioxygenase-like lactoylglutathione lyase family enzyme